MSVCPASLYSASPRVPSETGPLSASTDPNSPRHLALAASRDETISQTSTLPGTLDCPPWLVHAQISNLSRLLSFFRRVQSFSVSPLSLAFLPLPSLGSAGKEKGFEHNNYHLTLRCHDFHRTYPGSSPRTASNPATNPTYNSEPLRPETNKYRSTY